jgi:hypothetical protein
VRALAPVFAAVAASLHSAPSQTFVFLATLGATLSPGGGGRHTCSSLPAPWAACLAPPTLAQQSLA